LFDSIQYTIGSQYKNLLYFARTRTAIVNFFQIIPFYNNKDRKEGARFRGREFFFFFESAVVSNFI